MDDNDQERKRVNLRVEADTKDKWDAYVDKSDEYTTLSGLIRSAVNTEITATDDRGSDDSRDDDGTGDSRNHDERFDKIESLLEQVQQSVESQYTDVPPSDAGNEPQPYPEKEVFQALPDDGAAVTASQLAEELDYEASIVTNTLGEIMRKSESIERERIDGVTVYSKEV
jgi:hypothetical protein